MLILNLIYFSLQKYSFILTCSIFLTSVAAAGGEKKCIILVTGSVNVVRSKGMGKIKVKWQKYKGNIVDAIESACKEFDVRVLFVPVSKNSIDFYSELADGLILSGGGASVPGGLYGSKHASPRLSNSDFGRSVFDVEIFHAFYAKKKPVLGICLGAEIINVALGGSLIQDVEYTNGRSLVLHRKEGSFAEAIDNFHEVQILKGTFLHKAIKKNNIQVNSVHYAAIDKLGDRLAVSAFAADGVVEAIEGLGTGGFVLGVQWHPEVKLDESSRRIFKAYCRAVVDSCLSG